MPRGIPLRVDPHRGHPELGFISGVFADPRRPRHAVSIRRFMLSAAGAEDPRDAGVSAALFAMEMDGAEGSAGGRMGGGGSVQRRESSASAAATPRGRAYSAMSMDSMGAGSSGGTGGGGGAPRSPSMDRPSDGGASSAGELSDSIPPRWDQVG